MDSKHAATLLKRLARDGLLSFMHQHKQRVALIASVLLASVGLAALSPLAIARLIEQLAEHYRDDGALWYIGAYVLLRFLGQALTDARWVLINPTLYNATYAFCHALVERIAALHRGHPGVADSASQVAERGAILSKMQVGLMAVLHSLLVVILPALFECVLLMALVYWFLGPFFIVYFLIGACVLFFSTGVGRVREVQCGQCAYEADNQVLAYSGSILANGKLAREMAAEIFFRRQLGQRIDTALGEYQRLFAQKYRRATYLTLCICAAYVGVFGWAGWLVEHGAIGAGQIFLLVVYLDRLLAPVTQASAAFNNLLHGLISIRAGYGLLDTLAASAPPVLAAGPVREVRLQRELAFSYEGNTLHLGRGTRIRVVGPSGAGKTTWLRGVYQVLLAGGAVRPEQVHYLGAQVEWVPGTLFENIALGHPGLSEVRVQRELDLWATAFGNRALMASQPIAGLSAGELQWMALVRSLLRQAQVLILDEATHSLDVRTEPQVWRYLLRQLPTQAVLLLVSHRGQSPVEVDVEWAVCGWD
ncbi:ATP-binding cassette domain-containing protein [Pseudomonas sp. NPDC007930]|uniref:ATP-binding cassette domain-containing protein n=1 Tax=Pseudomonas sp. NPDC007930 TaxID=3364417 RepID=UPI0036EA59D2